MDLRILAWTVAAVLFGREVAVHRGTGALSVRAPRNEPQEMEIGRAEA
jgi:hypothetical protein